MLFQWAAITQVELRENVRSVVAESGVSRCEAAASLQDANLRVTVDVGARNDSHTPSTAPAPTPSSSPDALLKGKYVAESAQQLPGFKAGPEEVHRLPNRAWFLLGMAEHSAAAFDAWSTRRALTASGGYEADPFMRPFARSPAIYAAIQAGPLGLDYIARRMSRSSSWWMRRMWWLPQAASTAGFLFSGARNVSRVK